MVKSVVEKMMFLFKQLSKIHTANKKLLSLRNAKKHKEEEEEEEEEEDNVVFFSSLYASLQRRNGLAGRESASADPSGVFDTQSLSGSLHTPLQSDHLSVIASTSESPIRYEELCLILLRGVMERLVLQLNPCMESSRETVGGTARREA